MTEVQKLLTIKYRKLFGVSKLLVSNDTTDIIFDDQISNNYSSVVGNCIVNNNLICDSLYLLNNITCTNLISSSDITITNNSIFNNLTLTNLNINNNCIISNNAIITGNTIHNKITQLASLNVNNVLANVINTNNIYQYSNIININSDSITIGKPSGIINILGTVSYISGSNLKISDKLITLKDTSLVPNSYYGFDILGTDNNNGFIKTLDNDRYEIKAPLDTVKKYIVEVDLNENINITGVSVFYNNVTVLSNINILKDTTYNKLYVNNLYISSFSVCNNYYSNNINISDLTYISNNVYTNKLISNNINVLNMTALSLFNVQSNFCVLSNMTLNSNLIVNNNVIVKNNMTILSSLTINASTIVNNNLTVNSNLYISSTALLNNNLSVSKLNVFSDTLINDSFTLTSKLTVGRNMNIVGNVTLNSPFIAGTIIMPLVNYTTNNEAAVTIPKWGLYRTGGIVKIRLDIIAPVIILNGGTVSITTTQFYTDPGVTTTDNDDSGILTYITSIKNNSTAVEILPNILVSTSSITTTLKFTAGTYTITYTAYDLIGNIGTKPRTLNVS